MPSSRVTKTELQRLENAARAAAKRAYAPYSKFPVGAAIQTAEGKNFSGCNVKNASYGLCNCAERTTIFSAIAKGQRQLRCVVVYTPTPKATALCGACRQVIYEFGPTARVISICDSEDRMDTTIEELLPGAFGPEDLS
ncbi:MAG: cytidine deaminase [Candidatus Synoicihabitans palmerolidicus]|nr:cytidine deaminase [Candidatus Synoicihabitans palmerolidicus]